MNTPSYYLKLLNAIQIKQITTLNNPLWHSTYTTRGYILEYIIKNRWDSSHKLPPVAKNTRKVGNALGELYLSIVDLTQECHFIHSPNAKNYPSASEWFGHVLMENAMECFELEGTKSSIITKIQNGNKSLKNYDNPFTPDCHHTFGLIEDVLAIAQMPNMDNFRKNFLTPFIKRRSLLAQALRESEGISTVIDAKNQKMTLPGKGKGTINASSYILKRYK